MAFGPRFPESMKACTDTSFNLTLHKCFTLHGLREQTPIEKSNLEHEVSILLQVIPRFLFVQVLLALPSRPGSHGECHRQRLNPLGVRPVHQSQWPRLPIEH